MTLGRSRWRRLLRSAIAYGVVAVVTTVCFVFLHHLGNQTPLAVVAPKLVAEFKAEPMAWGTRWDNFHQPWEYCYISGAVLAGAMPSTTPLYDALDPRILDPDGSNCHELTRFASDPGQWAFYRLAQLQEQDDESGLRKLRMRSQQWFGSKALYAIGLRFLGVRQYHEFIRVATYAAYVILAAALLLLGWRVLLAASPLLLFGAAFSGIEHMSNVAKGTPYIWALVAPALLALLLRCARVPAFATRLFCFFAGMVACYLWLFGGANFLAAVLIGLVAWLHGEPSAVKARAARSATCVLALAAGFVVGMAMTVVKALPPGPIGPQTSQAIWADLSRIFAPLPHDLLGKEIGMWMEGLPLSVPAAHLLVVSAVIALGAALLTAGHRAWRRDWRPLQEVLWIGVLGISPLIHFLLPNDTAYATARLMYLPLALCWTAFALVLLRTPRAVVHAFVFLAVGCALAALRLAWEDRAATALLKRVDDAAPERLPNPLMDGYFDVYLDGRQLIYHRDRCERGDMKRRIVVDVFPKDLTALPDEHKAAGRVRAMFYFASHRWFTFGEDCMAVVDLPTFPAFPIAKIATERYCCYEGERTWQVAAILDREPLRRAARTARTVPPIARGAFDIHRVGDDLVYLREPCAKEDVRLRFFLSVFPKQGAGRDGGGSELVNMDFDFFEQGVLDDGQCVAVKALPHYAIDRIHTGQFGEGKEWKVEFSISQE